MLPELWAHQKEAVETKEDTFCLFFDTGTGKTRTVLEKKRKRNPDRIIVTAPLNVCRNWLLEIEKYLGPQSVFLVSGQVLKKKKEIVDSFGSHQGPCILVVNTDSWRVDGISALLMRIPCKYFVIDEAHHFKNSESARSKGLLRYVQHHKPQYIEYMSGTPMPQGAIDLHMPMVLTGETTDNLYVWKKKHFIDVNESDKADKYLMNLFRFEATQSALGMEFRDWKRFLLSTIRQPHLKEIWQRITNLKLCVTPFVDWRLDMIERLKSYPKLVLRKESEEIFADFLMRKTLSADKNKCLDLPPFVRTNVFCDMDETVAKHYREMEEEFYTELSTGENFVARNALVKLLRLQQIAAGFIGETQISDYRLEAFEYCLDLIGNKQFLVWTIFRPTYQQLASVLDRKNISYAMIHGDIKAETRAFIIKQIQSGDIQAVIANPQAGGEGVEMQAASEAIVYTKSYNLVHDLQLTARNYRGGSEIHDKITRYDILASETVDEKVHAGLCSKESVQNFLLKLRERRLAA